MNEHPIIFSDEMVRAILAGTKTQTRRVIKPQPPADSVLGDTLRTWTYDPQHSPRLALAWRDLQSHPGMDLSGAAICPYGQAGKLLWCKESWYQTTNKDFTPGKVIYKADGWEREDKGIIGWKSPLFMPRAYSRITLEIVSIWVQRVQEISYRDAIAEGVEKLPVYHEAVEIAGAVWLGTGGLPARIFKALWDLINAKRGYPWESNPWVWVIEFKKIDNENQPTD